MNSPKTPVPLLAAGLLTLAATLAGAATCDEVRDAARASLDTKDLRSYLPEARVRAVNFIRREHFGPAWEEYWDPAANEPDLARIPEELHAELATRLEGFRGARNMPNETPEGGGVFAMNSIFSELGFRQVWEATWDEVSPRCYGSIREYREHFFYLLWGTRWPAAVAGVMPAVPEGTYDLGAEVAAALSRAALTGGASEEDVARAEDIAVTARAEGLRPEELAGGEVQAAVLTLGRDPEEVCGQAAFGQDRDEPAACDDLRAAVATAVAGDPVTHVPAAEAEVDLSDATAAGDELADHPAPRPKPEPPPGLDPHATAGVSRGDTVGHIAAAHRENLGDSSDIPLWGDDGLVAAISAYNQEHNSTLVESHGGSWDPNRVYPDDQLFVPDKDWIDAWHADRTAD